MDTAAPYHYQLCIGGRVENPTQNSTRASSAISALRLTPATSPAKPSAAIAAVSADHGEIGRPTRQILRATAKEARRKATIASRLIHMAIERRPIGPAQPAGSAW